MGAPRLRPAWRLVLFAGLAAGCELDRLVDTPPPAPTARLSVTTQPGTVVAGSPFALTVSAVDAAGAVTPAFSEPVTVALAANPSGGTLRGTALAKSVNGVARFSDLTLDKAVSGYTITVSSGGFSSVSDTIRVVPGDPTRMVWAVQPSPVPNDSVMRPPVKVSVLDAFDNVATNFGGMVTLTLGKDGSFQGKGSLAGATSVQLAGGVAMFDPVRVDQPGKGYTLKATTGTVASESAPFDVLNVTPPVATHLAFTAQPSSAQAGASLGTVQVSALDVTNNVMTGFTGSITLTIGANPGGGTLSGTVTVAAANGVGTFSNLSIDQAGTAYTLVASSSGLTGTASSAFNITASPPPPPSATHLAFSAQPSNAQTGASLGTVRVSALDATNNVVTAFIGSITIAIGANPGGGTLSGTATVAATNGVATFSNLSIDQLGTGYTLVANTSGLTGTASAAFNVTAPPATHLAFSTQPTSTQAGTTIAAVRVSALDASNNVVTGFTGSIAVAIGTNPSAGTLSGTLAVTATSGVATFSNLSINQLGTGYTLAASSSGLTGATSTAFNVTAPPATHLAFSTQPTSTQAGTTISTVQVSALDASNNVVPGFTGSITMAIGTNPAAGTLTGTLTAAAVSGVATFSNLSINNAGSGYTLAASTSGLTGATSTTFNVTAAPPPPATHLVFSTQPTSTQAGTTIATVRVSALDASNNVVGGFTGAITVAIGTNPAGGTLSGTLSVAAVSGVATFANLSINQVGSGYTLVANSSGLTGATSTTFNITAPPATHLAFSVQPTSAQTGATISPAVQVSALDASNAVVTGYSGTITVAIGTNPAAGTLTGTLSAAAVNGVATFANLSINNAGSGYTLVGNSSGLTGATSTAFNITAPPATHLAFSTQPTSTQAGTTIATVRVSALDASNNVVPGFTGSIAVAIGTNPAAGTLTGTLSVAAVSGVATFSTLSINNAGSGYTLAASSSGLTGATSTAFNITAPPATHLVFSVQPSSAQTGATISPAVQVSALDASNNVVPGFTGSVTLAIGTNPAAGTLSGTVTIAAVSGVATFSNLSINNAGSGYTLAASSSGLTGATSTAFNITAPPATHLVFSTQPTSTQAGATIATVRVTALDASNAVVTGYTGTITVAIGTNPAAGTLSGTLSAAAVSGVATFANLSINNVGTGYTLTSAASGLTGATSTAFNVTAPPATHLVFSVQPSSAQSGATISPAVQVSALDASNNVVTGFTGSITVAIGTNPSGGTLSGTLTVAAVSGVATFSNVSIDKAGAGYTLTAAASGLTGATSATFTITAPPATHLSFSVQPSNTQAGATITPSVQVSALDASNNVVTGFTGSITVAIGTNPGSGTLAGTLTAAAVNGVATFANLSINNAGTGYTLSTTSTGLTGATSTAFNITAAPATHLAFTVQPSDTRVNATITPPVQVSVLDAQGRVVTSFSGTVTVAIGNDGSGLGSANLHGTLTVTVVNGVATFSDLSIDTVGAGYTLTASTTGLTGATSAAFDITLV